MNIHSKLMPQSQIKLAEYSHGAGCGCKIAPHLQDDIPRTQMPTRTDPCLLVGNDSRDEAAVYDLALGCSPGGTQRNVDSYGHRLAVMDDVQRQVLCDPQTSGGLLVAVTPGGVEAFLQRAEQHGMGLNPIGELKPTDATALIRVI